MSYPRGTQLGHTHHNLIIVDYQSKGDIDGHFRLLIGWNFSDCFFIADFHFHTDFLWENSCRYQLLVLISGSLNWFFTMSVLPLRYLPFSIHLTYYIYALCLSGKVIY